MIAYKLYQACKDGSLWVSTELEHPTERHIAQCVIAGCFGGEPRWARALDGKFIYGVNARGAEIKGDANDCSICRSVHGREIVHACE